MPLSQRLVIDLSREFWAYSYEYLNKYFETNDTCIEILLSNNGYTIVFCTGKYSTPPKGQIPNWRDNDIRENIIEYTSGGAVRRFITQVTQPELTVYPPDYKVSTGIGVIICPGGAYSQLAMDHEGHYMAMKYNENGIAAFVLKYRMPIDKSVDNKEMFHFWMPNVLFKSFGKMQKNGV